MNKYEQLIEHIINDEEDKARALFHEIVVEKSRDIYESLMDEEYTEEDIGGSPVGEMMREIDADSTGGIGEGEGEFELDGEDDGNLTGDFPSDGMDSEEGDLEQKVMDLEDELEALKAEFEQLMGGDEGDMDDMGDMGDMGDKEDDEEEDDEMMEMSHQEEEMEESVYESTQRRPLQKTAVDLMREYVEKIGAPSGPMAGSGAGGDSVNVNDHSVVAGKNDMGGTAQNIAKGGSEQAPDGTSPKGKADGKLVKNVQEVEVAKRNVNKVGGDKGAQNFYKTKAKAKSGEGQTTDGSVPTNHRSIEGGGN